MTEKKQLRLSHSSRGTLSSCARKFELNRLYDQPARTMEWEDLAAEVGKSIHEGYQNYLITRDTDSAIWALTRHYPHELMPDSSHDRSWEAALSTMLAMIEAEPMREYELAMIQNNKGVIVPAIEVPFQFDFTGIDIPGYDIIFVGYMDAILRHRLTRAYRTCDVKTHRRYGNADAKYQFSGQQVPYGIALEHIQGNVIESFEVSYFDAFVDVLSPVPSVYNYTITQTHVQEWLSNLVIQLRTLKSYIDMDLFPRTEHGCLFYNKACKHLSICQSRDHDTIQKWLLLDKEPAQPRVIDPWIHGVINIPEGLI